MTVQRPRDAKRSRQLILDVAEVEFSAKGIHGARVDEIPITPERLLRALDGRKETQ